MIGLVLHIALHDSTPLSIEVQYCYLENARRKALTALALARRYPHTPPEELAALESMIADYEAGLRKLEPNRLKSSACLVTRMTTWGTSDRTL